MLITVRTSSVWSSLSLAPLPPDTPKQLQLKPGDQIVAIGDSITAGGGYLRDIDAVLAAQYPDLKLPKVINKGIGGQKAEDLVRRFDADVVKLKPACRDHQHRHQRCLAPFGQPHDAKILAVYKKNVATMVDQAQQAGIKVILLTPTLIQEDANTKATSGWCSTWRPRSRLPPRRNASSSICTACSSPRSSRSRPTRKAIGLLGDGVHMKPLGDAIMAAGVLRALGVPDKTISVRRTRPRDDPYLAGNNRRPSVPALSSSARASGRGRKSAMCCSILTAPCR